MDEQRIGGLRRPILEDNARVLIFILNVLTITAGVLAWLFSGQGSWVAYGFIASIAMHLLYGIVTALNNQPSKLDEAIWNFGGIALLAGIAVAIGLRDWKWLVGGATILIACGVIGYLLRPTKRTS